VACSSRGHRVNVGLHGCQQGHREIAQVNRCVSDKLSYRENAHLNRCARDTLFPREKAHVNRCVLDKLSYTWAEQKAIEEAICSVPLYSCACYTYGVTWSAVNTHAHGRGLLTGQGVCD
jgi:hypothetical protein